MLITTDSQASAIITRKGLEVANHITMSGKAKRARN